MLQSEIWSPKNDIATYETSFQAPQYGNTQNFIYFSYCSYDILLHCQIIMKLTNNGQR